MINMINTWIILNSFGTHGLDQIKGNNFCNFKIKNNKKSNNKYKIALTKINNIKRNSHIKVLFKS
jgi:hypothetical protein